MAQEAAIKFQFAKNIPNSVNAQNVSPRLNPVLPPQTNLTSDPVSQNTQNKSSQNKINGNNNKIVDTQINNQVTIINKIFVVGIEGIENAEGMKVKDIVKTIDENNNENLADCLINLGVHIKEADKLRHYQKYDARSIK